MIESRPDTASGAYEATREDRTVVRDMLEGLPAIQRYGAGTSKTDGTGNNPYLQKWPDESAQTYRERIKYAVFTPLLADIHHGLTSKPFTKEVAVVDGASDRFKALAENIDGEGNSLHVFAHSVFQDAVADGYHAILVDYPQAERTLTRAEQQARQIRPYWVSVAAENILALYTRVEGGVEIITHVRIRETSVERDPGTFKEFTVERIRVLEPGTWTLWRAQADTDGNRRWVVEAEGVHSIGIVPLALVYVGKRRGPQLVTPPLASLARQQATLFQEENDLKSVRQRTAFPMYAGNGMVPPTDGAAVSVGPGAFLFTGEDASVEVLEPSGSSLEQLRAIIDERKQEMRRLGMQPLLPGTGTVTATATGVEAAKAHSAVQMWALALKDALENAFQITALWLNEQDGPEVYVHTEFGLDAVGGQDDATLLALRENGTISRVALVDEMKRRGRLSADYDPEEDQREIDAESEGLLPVIDPVLAPQPQTVPGEQSA